MSRPKKQIEEIERAMKFGVAKIWTIKNIWGEELRGEKGISIVKEYR